VVDGAGEAVRRRRRRLKSSFNYFFRDFGLQEQYNVEVGSCISRGYRGAELEDAVRLAWLVVGPSKRKLWRCY
jgi:hypothetical protein